MSGTRQYLRNCKLILAGADDGIDVGALKTTFTVRQGDLQTPNSLEARVYNPNSTTVVKSGVEFDRVILQCGYGVEGDVGTIFDGTIIQTNYGREDGANTYLSIYGAEGDSWHNFAVVYRTLAAGATARDRLNSIALTLPDHGLSAGPAGMPESNGLPRGSVMYGMARDHMNDLAKDVGGSWSVQGRTLQLLTEDAYLPGEAVVLNAGTGMVGLPEQTQDGLRVRCLLNPRIKVGGRVHLDSSSVQQAFAGFDLEAPTRLGENKLPRISTDGFYRVLAVDHTGDTRGQAWYTDLICVGIDVTAPQSQIEKGRA